MIEIAVGVAALLGAAAVALGYAQPLTALPIGVGTASLIALLGLLLVAHGTYRVRLKRSPGNRHRVRSSGLTGLLLVLTAVLTLGVPLAAPLLNVFKVSGFPLGYYVTAQGALVALVVLMFIHALRSDTIDEQEGARED